MFRSGGSTACRYEKNTEINKYEILTFIVFLKTPMYTFFRTHYLFSSFFNKKSGLFYLFFVSTFLLFPFRCCCSFVMVVVRRILSLCPFLCRGSPLMLLLLLSCFPLGLILQRLHSSSPLFRGRRRGLCGILHKCQYFLSIFDSGITTFIISIFSSFDGAHFLS